MDDAQLSSHFAATDRYIADMDERLRLIARQNAVLGEMVELAGSHMISMAATIGRIDASLASLHARFGDLSSFVNTTSHIHPKEPNSR